MFRRISPEEAGIPRRSIDRFLNTLERYEINLHSALMLRGDGLFFERYWAPFDENTPHRMYSVTKSFVSAAIGCLLDEGKLRLDDPITDYFPDKLPDEVSPLLARQTIRDMLSMRTCFPGSNWFLPEVTDRTRFYFSQKPVKPSGTLFEYDSTGSYILGVLVERLSGMPLLDYLKLRILNHLGGFENARMLTTPGGTSWGDSALLCTPQAMLHFARFVMNLGVWDGKRLLSESYLREAIGNQVPTDQDCRRTYNNYGYGYQIWMSAHNSFSFNGMGAQFAVCVPEKDFIFVCTGDNQYNRELAAPILYRAIFEDLLELSEDVPERHSLPVAHGCAGSPFMEKINGTLFRCSDNPMGISRFRLCFGDSCCLQYTNSQGDKQLDFSMKENRFGLFPQFGYSDDVGNTHEITDFRYRCAASAGWISEKTLQIRVQIIDRYFGSLVITFGFRDETIVGVRMVSVGEDFLGEYAGMMIAERADD